MNIKSISQANINFGKINPKQKDLNHQNSKKKNNIKKAVIITGALSAAAITGILLAKKVTISKKLLNLSKETSELTSKEFFDSINNGTPETTTKYIKTTLSNGIEKLNKIQTDVLSGTEIETVLAKPVNGVKTIQTHKFSNGDTSQVSVYDSWGNLIKDIKYKYNYMQRKRLENISVATDAGNIQIDYEYLKHLPDKIKSVKIIRPDGSEKLTLLPISLKDKIADLIHK